MSDRRFGSARKSGFTLIELLVVVAIIALLVSILLPSLARARELARRTVCGTRMKGIGLAAEMYTSEFGVYPGMFGQMDSFPWNGYVAANRCDYWFGRLSPYMSKVDFGGLNTERVGTNYFRCPSVGIIPEWKSWASMPVSYVGSMKAFKGPTYWASQAAWNAAEFQSPDTLEKTSEQLLAGEALAGALPYWGGRVGYRDSNNYDGGRNDHVWGDGNQYNVFEPVIRYPHLDGEECNVLFADGHVEMAIDFMQGREYHYQDPTNTDLEDPDGWSP